MTNQEAVRILNEQRNKFMDEWVDFGGVNEAYNIAIQALKEQEVPKWRLCSEELPETNDEVLITYTVFGNKKKRFVETASYCDDVDGEGHWNSVWDEYRIAREEKEVIAWMPLPKPYMEGW